MLLGLDDFSRINLLNDHAFGNTVLRMFVRSTQRLIPEGASMFRLDGDVFAIVMDGAGRAAMEGPCRAFHLAAHRQHTIGDLSFFCMVSAGIAMIGQDAQSAQNLLRNAENALGERNSAERTLPRSSRPQRSRRNFAAWRSATAHSLPSSTI